MNQALRSFSLWLAGSTLFFPSLAKADVSYQETTQITGGSATGMLKMVGAFSSKAKQMTAPIVSHVMIHRNLMVRSDPHSTQIIDLDKQTITYVDNDKQTYSTTTFAQMKQAMAKAAADAKRSPNQSSSDPASQMKVDAHISRSGATRDLDGMTAKEALLTVTMLAEANDGSNTQAGMAATSEMWMIDSAPGMEEMRTFSRRLATELGTDPAGSPVAGLLSAYPGAAQALADLRKESTALTGVSVLQITRVGFSADGKPLPAPSVAPLPAQSKTEGNNKAGQIAGDVATDTGTQAANEQVSRMGTFGRALGSGLGSLARNKPSLMGKKPSTSNDQSAANPATAGVLLEMQTKISDFSTGSVAPNAFQIPAGYSQVSSSMPN